MTDVLANSLMNILELRMFVYMVGGLAIGVMAGAIPGLNGGIAIALLLPLTYNMDLLGSLVLLTAVYTGSCFGGAITAILLNAPGAPAAIASAFDGYPMTRQGLASRALGIGLGASALGGLVGMIVLIIIIYPLARFALKFGPPETFLLVVFALTSIASIASNSLLKGLIAGLFGVLIGTIGMTASGRMRFTFGSVYLMDGIPVIAALIGFLAISEIVTRLQTLEAPPQRATERADWRQILQGSRVVLAYPGVFLRSSMIGVFVGAIPGIGATIGSLISYDAAKRLARGHERFGEGEPAGLIAAESANNSSEGGAMATMLALGIPGGAATAILLGALILHGVTPGPRLVFEHTELIYSLLIAELFQEILLFVVGIVVAMLSLRVIYMPFHLIVPGIVLMCFLGAFSIRSTEFDAALLFGFGFLGWIMRSQGYPVVAIVIGVILGPVADAEFIRTNQLYDSWLVFVTRPICLLLTVLIVANLALPFLWPTLRRTWKSAARRGKG